MKYKRITHPDWKFETTDITFYRNPRLAEIDVESHWYDIEGGEMVIRTRYAWDGVTAFPDHPTTDRAALIHDVLMQAIYDDKTIPRAFLTEAHKIMYDAMKSDGVALWRRAIIYAGLRAFHNLWHSLKLKHK